MDIGNAAPNDLSSPLLGTGPKSPVLKLLAKSIGCCGLVAAILICIAYAISIWYGGNLAWWQSCHFDAGMFGKLQHGLLLDIVHAPLEEKVEAILNQMTASEKCGMIRGMGTNSVTMRPLPGYYVGNTKPVERLGIPSLKLMDAGQGFRTMDATGVGQATAWPCALAVAASWDESLMERWGRALGVEHRAKGANVILGPAVNVHRVPRGGRNAEYLSGEEPHLGRVMARAYVRGVQSQGIMATVKHFVLNNQETNRNTQSSNVDARTMWEIYYEPFRGAIEAGVASAMCSYNLVNGTHACENADALVRDLKESMGFNGWVMSDWGAVHSFSAEAGLDQEMPGCQPLSNWLRIVNCWFSDSNLNTLDESKVNDMVRRMLMPMLKSGLLLSDASTSLPSDRCSPPTCHALSSVDARSDAHTALAREIAASSAILLKNEGHVLPIRSGQKVAVVGSACNASNDVEKLLNTWDMGNAYVVGGSGRVIPAYAVSVLDGLRDRAGKAWINATVSDDQQAAVAAANASDVVVVCGYTTSSESWDRSSLSVEHEDFIQYVATHSSAPVVVVTMTPGAVVMPWIDHAAAAVNMFHSGQETGRALADVLFGDVNPSGKSPVSFPLKETDVIPPCQTAVCEYSESLFVGWRSLEGKKVVFPFGHGLSYTAFDMQLVLPLRTSDCAGALCVTVKVANIGNVSGAEVIQLYLGFPEAAEEPPKVLRGFRKVPLAPRESSLVEFTLLENDLQIFDPASWSWKTIDGDYILYIGSSSRDMHATSTFSIYGGSITPKPLV